MKGFVKNIEEIAVANTDFRQVLYTANYSQLVIMAFTPRSQPVSRCLSRPGHSTTLSIWAAFP